MARTPSFSLDQLTPEKRGGGRAQPVKAGDPIRTQTIRLQASVWQKLRMLAAVKGTTSTWTATTRALPARPARYRRCRVCRGPRRKRKR